MTLRGRLAVFGAISLLTSLALGATVFWGAGLATRLLAARQRATDRSDACLALSLEVPALVMGPAGSQDRAGGVRQQLERAARLFGPGDGAEEVEQVGRAVEQLGRSRAGPAGDGPGTAVDVERDILAPITRLTARARQLDRETSRLTAEAIGSARALAGTAVTLALVALLLAAFSVTPRLRRGLAALEAGARRISAGDLATRIALPGRDELSSLGAAIDAMAAELHGTMISRAQAETLVRDRTAELERTRQDLAARLSQLESVRLQLDAADRLVAADRLARGLTHEINNPLAILLADVEFAFEELEARAASGPGASGPPDEVISALDEARQAGRRIALIVRELMSFSRDRSPADQGPTDLAEVLAHAVRLAGPELRRHARLVEELPPGPILVQGNQARMGLAFLELLHGAAAAVAAAGRPDGTITLVLRPEPGGAVVEVRDDGVPVPDDLLPHLFDPFFTQTAGFAAGGAGLRGTGLGLASCLAIIQAAGGRLEVASAVGTGTVFRAWLPAASTQSRVALRAGPRDVARSRLLVVEVDPFDCATAYRALSRDFDVAPHTGVASALALLRAGDRFDLILCDPGSGRALAEALTADGSSQAGRLVLVGGADAPSAPATAGLPRLERPLSAGGVLELLRRRAAERGPA